MPCGTCIARRRSAADASAGPSTSIIIAGRIYRFKPRYNATSTATGCATRAVTAFPRFKNETRLTSPLVQAEGSAGGRAVGEGVRRAASIIADYKRRYGSNTIAAVVDAHSTNEEAFALKQLMKTAMARIESRAELVAARRQRRRRDALPRQQESQQRASLAALGSGGRTRRTRCGGRIGRNQDADRVSRRPGSCAGEEEFVRRFGALDYMLVLSTDANETCQMANQIWPIAASPEIDGSFTELQGPRAANQRGIPATGERHRQGIEAIARLGQALDGQERPHSRTSYSPRWPPPSRLSKA